jgi:hypothetical protein
LLAYSHEIQCCSSENLGHCWLTTMTLGTIVTFDTICYSFCIRVKKSTVPLSCGYQWSNLLMSPPMMWHEEHLLNFSVLQKEQLSNIVYLTGPQEWIFLPCKLSHKLGEEYCAHPCPATVAFVIVIINLHAALLLGKIQSHLRSCICCNKWL